MHFSNFNKIESTTLTILKNSQPLQNVKDLKFYKENVSGVFKSKNFRWSFNGVYWSSWNVLTQTNFSKIKINSTDIFFEFKYELNDKNSRVFGIDINYDEITSSVIVPQNNQPILTNDVQHPVNIDVITKYEIKEVTNAELFDGKPPTFYLDRNNYSGTFKIANVENLQFLLDGLNDNDDFIYSNINDIRSKILITDNNLNSLYLNQLSQDVSILILGNKDLEIDSSINYIFSNFSKDVSTNELSILTSIHDSSIGSLIAKDINIDSSLNDLYTKFHDPIIIDVSNGLSLILQTLSLDLASVSQTGALSSSDWNTFNNKQDALNGVIDSHSHTYLSQPNGLNNFVYTDNQGTLHIDGSISQNGNAYETHLEQVYTKNDYIILRDGAILGLSNGSYAGFLAKKYDGLNDGHLVFDNTGTARIGDVGFEQPLATRVENPTDKNIAFWDSLNNRLDFKILKSIDILGLDSSLNVIWSNQISQDVSIIDLRNKDLNIDSSLNSLWTGQISQDTSISSLRTKDLNIDSSLNSLWSNQISQDASIIGLKNKDLNIDSSLNSLWLQIGQGTNVDASLNSIILGQISQDASISLLKVKDLNIDSSLNLLWSQMGQGTNVDASLNSLINGQVSQDASISLLKTKDLNIDSSLNSLWSNQITQDASISLLKTKDLNIDSSLNTIWINLNNKDVSLNSLWSYEYIQDTSISLLKTKDLNIDVSLNSLWSYEYIQDTSISLLKTKDLNIDSSLNSLWVNLNNKDVSLNSLWSNQIIQDASIILLKSKDLNIDVSLNSLWINLNNKDVSLNSLWSYEYIQDTSISLLKTKDLNIDSSLNTIWVNLNNKDVSLNSLWSNQITQDASIVGLRNKDLNIDSSLNSIWSYETTQDTSIVGLRTKTLNIDSSLNSLYSEKMNVSDMPTRTSYSFISNEGQTIYNAVYNPGNIDVFFNGVRLDGVEYVATNGTTITLVIPAIADDLVDIISYSSGFNSKNWPSSGIVGSPNTVAGFNYAGSPIGIPFSFFGIDPSQAFIG